MISRTEYEDARNSVMKMFSAVQIALTPAERDRIEVADFGLNDLKRIGLQLLTYVNTDRVCAKELVLFPHQTCPEHCHPPIGEDPGKEETFRCLWGEVYLYVPGERTETPKATVPDDLQGFFTVWHEVRLQPGEQYTLLPNTPHWFQAGPGGAVVSEFSTRSRDEYDVFTDPRIVRAPHIGSE